MLDANVANLLKKAPTMSFTLLLLIIGSLVLYYLANKHLAQARFSLQFNLARLVGLLPLGGLFAGLIVTGIVRITLVAIWKGNAFLMLSGLFGLILVWTFYLFLNFLFKAEE